VLSASYTKRKVKVKTEFHALFYYKTVTNKERESEWLFLASFYVLMGEEVRESGAFKH
jgi:hypothetical protein